MRNEVICWLNCIVGLSAVMWLPYVLNRALKQGLLPAMGYGENLPALSPWAQRMKAAHYNAVENLVVLAPTTILYLMLGGTDYSAIKCALSTYFICRIIHFITYSFAIPYVRTIAFFVGWSSTMFIIYKTCTLAGQA